jgi:glycosyltransferase involved in cell wall biosynthesis
MKYSFVVPIYNDGELADDFCSEFESVFRGFLKKDDISADAELIFVNDGSFNNSMELLIEVSGKYNFVKAIELSRNFGHHIAISCGYEYAIGDYVGMMDVDMEDPPAEIPKLLNYIEQNDVDMVSGLRVKREGPLTTRLTSYLFNIMLTRLTGYNIPANTSGLRIMNRKFINAYKSLSEKSRFLPGLEMWLGFKRGYVSTEHKVRQRGKSSYNFKRRVLLALDSILSFSDVPLKIIVFLGLGTVILGVLMNLVLVLVNIFGVKIQHGYTSTISIIVFLGGIEILVTGLGSLYIGRILKEVQNRPLYIVRNKYNFKENES